jgi:hypothetical protein
MAMGRKKGDEDLRGISYDKQRTKNFQEKKVGLSRKSDDHCRNKEAGPKRNKWEEKHE